MAYVTQLVADETSLLDPSWEEVEAAIVRLDAVEWTLVVLSPAAAQGEHHMAIGGGLHDRCIVYMTEDNRTFWNLEDASWPAQGEVSMNVGRQVGDYSPRQCVPRVWALEAARCYFIDGGRATELPWKLG